jgi:polysaccharide biosynthesis protein PelF
MPHTSFLGYFWAWRTLVGGLLRILTFPLPNASLYHAVSTGYAGLLGARATMETGRPSIITEHGIYSNERRIEILMADWIANSIDNGLDLSDSRTDIREFWATAFDSFARISYSAATEITALYAANQMFQRGLGATDEKLRVIPNGVDIERYSAVAAVKHDDPTIAFIGRVTPIKDVQTFIDVADILRRQFPTLKALVIGPMDEDPEYADACMNEAHARGLDDTVTFTGPADVRSYLGRIDVLVLTSISEALPLVVLEAGAAGVPCVTTDVGACHEMLEGSIGGRSEPPGGKVVPVGASEEMAAAIGALLADPKLRRAYGRGLYKRVSTHYRAEVIADAYSSLYARTLAPQQIKVN